MVGKAFVHVKLFQIALWLLIDVVFELGVVPQCSLKEMQIK